jgi:hypothetical protein
VPDELEPEVCGAWVSGLALPLEPDVPEPADPEPELPEPEPEPPNGS